jgi:organic hydroperoxide reductase OsmC/OhrA
MAQLRAREFRYGVSLDEAWTARSDLGGSALANEAEEWTPEHLLLAGLARCVSTSLRHHATRAKLIVSSSARADGLVTLRPEDGRFALVEATVAVEASISPEPEPAALAELLAKAARDCFVGASLRITPTYRFTVNGREIA